MAISRIGASAIAATTITLPGTYDNGDVAIIFAFSGTAVAPTIPAGWTTLASGVTGATTGLAIGWKMLQSASDTSGTWTTASALACHVYRGTATNNTPLQGLGTTLNGASGTNVTYSVTGDNLRKNAWLIAFAGKFATTSTLETPPTGMVNISNVVAASVEIAGHDTNGAYATQTGTWPSTVVNTGVAGEWWSYMVQLLPEPTLLGDKKGIRPHPFSPGLAR